MKIIIFMFSLIFILFFDFSRADNSPGGKVVSLQGSRQSLLFQNIVIKNEGLTRIKDDKQLEEFVRKGILVPIDRLENVNIDYRLKQKYCYTMPYVADFLTDLGAAFFWNFGLYIMVNSAVRTVENQKELRKTNSNAASPTGPYGSPHPTGNTVDVAYTDMDDVQMEWTRSYLKKYKKKGLIVPIEEHTQTVFHIMVFPWYSKYRLNKK